MTEMRTQKLRTKSSKIFTFCIYKYAFKELNPPEIGKFL